MAIRALLFDLDDTLLWDDRSVKEAFDATCRAAKERYPALGPEKLEEEVRREARALYQTFDTFPFTQMIGINPFEALWANFGVGKQEEFHKLKELAPGYRTEAWTRGLKAVGVEDAELGETLGKKFAAERRARPYVYEETFEILDALKAKYKLLLLTNGAPDLQREKIGGVPQLEGYFDHIVISGSFGEGKPAPSIFRHAAELLDIQPEEGIMVGDKLTTDILGSNRIGMPNAWINRHGVERNADIAPRFEIHSLRELQSVIDELG